MTYTARAEKFEIVDEFGFVAATVEIADENLAEIEIKIPVTRAGWIDLSVEIQKCLNALFAEEAEPSK
jgi:hypothetical protein